MSEVTLARNYLIFTLIEKNFLRPCSLYHLPVSHFKPGAIKIDQETLTYEVPLFMDKTAGVTGLPNFLHLSGELVMVVTVFSLAPRCFNWLVSEWSDIGVQGPGFLMANPHVTESKSWYSMDCGFTCMLWSKDKSHLLRFGALRIAIGPSSITWGQRRCLSYTRVNHLKNLAPRHILHNCKVVQQS